MDISKQTFKPFSSAIYVGFACLYAFFFISTTGASFTWVALLFIALCFVSIALWTKDIPNVLFFGFVFSSSISLSKALIVEGGIYQPGLSLYLSDMFLLPFIFVWAVDKWILKKEKLYWSKLHTFPLLFLLWCWVTVSFSADTQAAFFMCLNYTKYFVVFLVIADYIRTSRHMRLALIAFALALCVHLLMVLVELAVGRVIDFQGAKTTTTGTSLVFQMAGGVHAFRPSGFMGHPNALAYFLVLILPTMLICLILGTRRIGHFTWTAIFVLFVIGILMLLHTLSRAGWISMTLATLFMLYVGYKRGIVQRKYINMLMMIGAISIVIAVLIFPTVYLRITESDERSSESRIAMMHQAGLIIQRNPVMGVGIAGYNRAARANIPEFFSHLSVWFQDELLKGVVHNKYLLVTAETGLIGLVLFLLILWRFAMAVPVDSYWPDPVTFALALGFTAGVVGQMSFYLFDHFYSDSRITLSYLLFGLIAAILKMKNTALAQQGTPSISRNGETTREY